MELARLRAQQASPKVLNDVGSVMLGLEKYLAKCGLEHGLLHLVKLRASQINGCAYCIDMHWKDARAGGESEQRLYMLDAWHEAPWYSERERAALRWTEAVTLVGEDHVPDEVYEEVRRSFDDDEIVNLTLAVVAINGWNRLLIPLRAIPGGYRPAGASAERLAAAAA